MKTVLLLLGLVLFEYGTFAETIGRPQAETKEGQMRKLMYGKNDRIFEGSYLVDKISFAFSSVLECVHSHDYSSDVSLHVQR